MEAQISPNDRIKAVRILLNQSQSEFAESLGLNDPKQAGRKTVSRWENGNLIPRLVYINAAEAMLKNRYLGQSIEDMLHVLAQHAADE
jgi:transcriptional regulator with XRE-family HTH domain